MINDMAYNRPSELKKGNSRGELSLLFTIVFCRLIKEINSEQIHRNKCMHTS